MLRSKQLLPNLLKRWKRSSVKLTSKRAHVRGLSLNRQQSSKIGNCRPKQREQLRTLNTPQTNNGMRDSMHASAVRAVFSLLLPVLSFVTDHAHQYIYVSVLWSSTSSFFPVNLKIILRNVTSRKNNDVQLQNWNLKFGIMSISYI